MAQAEKLLMIPSVKTVLEKTDKVSGRLRTIKTRHISGKKNLVADYRESECRFKFNVESCYFSPRLSNERIEVAALAQLTLARATHRRVAGLHAKKSATDQELDQATAALRAAEAQLAAATARETEAGSTLESARAGSEAAEATASFAVITAPFDGVVTEKLVEVGTMAAPGTPLVRVEDVREFRLDVRVDASRAGFVRPGDPVPVTIETRSGDTVVSGRVAEVARSVEADARAFLVNIALPDGVDVRPGTFGRARLPGARRAALTVPAEAVVRHGQVASVFVVGQQRVRLRVVNVGPEAEGRAEVLAGLVDGETVVVAPPAQLADGRAVCVGGRR